MGWLTNSRVFFGFFYFLITSFAKDLKDDILDLLRERRENFKKVKRDKRRGG